MNASIMKNVIAALVLLAPLWSCRSLCAATLIVPGESLGSVHLGDGEARLKHLGTSDGGDAALGHYWSYYNSPSGHHTLRVYTVRNEGGLDVIVKQVWTNSPVFHTQSGARVGDSLSEIRRLFPRIVLASRETNEHVPVTLLDDRAHGIAFEFRPGKSHGRERCTAIIIHPKATGVTDEYYSMYVGLD
jgi:hypothetical protein